MSQEDDLRGLAKVMDFMRALSVLFVIVNVYWFCYPSMKEWNIDIGVVDRILLNFQRTTQDTAQFPADDRAVLVHSLDKAVRPCVPRALLLGDERRERGKD